MNGFSLETYGFIGYCTRAPNTSGASAELLKRTIFNLIPEVPRDSSGPEWSRKATIDTRTALRGPSSTLHAVQQRHGSPAAVLLTEQRRVGHSHAVRSDTTV